MCPALCLSPRTGPQQSRSVLPLTQGSPLGGRGCVCISAFAATEAVEEQGHVALFLGLWGLLGELTLQQNFLKKTVPYL